MALPIGPRGGGGTQPTQPTTPSYGGSTGWGRSSAGFGGYGQRRGRQPQMGDDGIIIRRPDPGQPPIVGGQHPQPPPGGEDGLFDLPNIFPGLPGFGNFPIAPPTPPGGHGPLPRVPFDDDLGFPGTGRGVNPYEHIPGFEHYRERSEYIPGLHKKMRLFGLEGRDQYITPGRGWYPTLETVQGISNAMQHPMRTPTRGRGNGQGSAISGYEDQLKRLLADRMGFGGGE